MAHLHGGLSGWTAIAARTHRRYPRAGYLRWPLVAVGRRLEGWWRRTGCRKRDRRVGGMTPRFLPVPLAGLEPATCCLGDVSAQTLCSIAKLQVSSERRAK